MSSWKRIITSGSDAVLNTVSATSFIGPLNGTASWAVSSSRAITASFATQALSSSFTSTASFINTLNQNVTVNGTISGSSLYSNGDVTAAQYLRSLNSSGDEGGEIFLSKAVTNTSITGGVTIDVWQNRLRFFEQGGTARGYFLDITAGGAGVGTNLASGGSGFPFTGSAQITGSLGVTGSAYISGALGVGTSTPTTIGLIRATNDVIAFYSSDERLKTNKKIISNPVEIIQQLNGYKFTWIPKKGIHENKGKDIGIIAQEVEKVLPEIVVTRDNGYKAVKYEKIIAVLIEAVKELNNKIEILEEKINKNDNT
jgi:hypothetical protein